ncbi:hypothetical protein DPM19_22740 [Actinomadura craniellae]|uniref:Uncharacterized protein n=1 Tax=Actinomadura craniellae TaxID=2231787 RepID=A0A365H1C4_9ACTN|nr:hypothetical protein [Actinomadura craniellae]RAY12839.1 hypothetical protein DPM19_22740 [Actinomadura craniellae]
MSRGTARALAAAGTVAVAALVNVATGVLTQHWTAAWGAAAGVLVLLGGGLQAWLTVSERGPAGAQRSAGNRVGGSIRQTMRGSGEQSVTDSEAGGDLVQEQGPPS